MLDRTITDQDVASDALAGLTATPKTLPPKLFYDVEGVRLFAAITRLPEYTLTRTEHALLEQHAEDIAALAPAGAALVEYGASDEAKAWMLLATEPRRFAHYVPIDVASGALEQMRARLAVVAPWLRVHPVCADFMQDIELPAAVGNTPKFGFFPGSTIGNLTPLEARNFLAAAGQTLGPDAWFVVGVDLAKSPDLLIPAYDDAQGVTAAFNLNLLRRLNREAAANFDLTAFAHRAIWNAAESRVEMHLVSRKTQTVQVAGMTIQFTAGETIHTENSTKHSIAGFRALAEAAGWRAEAVWTDTGAMFAIHALRNDSAQTEESASF